MFKILSFLIISIFLIGCTNKNSAFRYFDKTDVQVKAVQNTKKVDILEGKESKVILWATYLNNIDKKDRNKEIFLVSVYFANEDNQDFLSKDYKFTLNSNEPTKFELADLSNKDFKDLMLKNNWGNYYIVEFDKINDSDKLNLKLFNNSSLAQLEFEK